MSVTLTGEPTVQTTPMVWSATRLKSYLTCPRQFRYAYIDGIPSVPTSPLVFGRTLHEALCFVQEHQMETGDLPLLGETLHHFDTMWTKALTQEQPFFREGAPSPAQHQTTGHEILRAYLSASSSQVRPLTAEMAFEITAGDYKLAGIVDRVEESETGLVIVDFKSGQRPPKKTDIDGDLQFTIYAFALSQMFGQRVEQVVNYHMRDGSRYAMIPGEEHFRWLQDEILPYVAGAVARQEFAPRSGYWCNWCDYRELCRAENAKRFQEKI